jgi:predicted phage tail protein
MSVQTIVLGGFLGRKYAEKVELHVENFAQAREALASRFGPGILRDIRSHSWHVINGPLQKGNDLATEEELSKPFTKKVLHILPVVEGESAGWRVVIGYLLMVVGIFTAAYGDGGFVYMIGASMVVGGVTDMLTKRKIEGPQQRAEEAVDPVYNGAQNVTTQGGAVPLVFGRVQRASSVVISTDFSSDEV